VAEQGGVSGIYVMPYLNDGHQPTGANVVAHIEHAIDVAGENHVSIGTDGGVSLCSPAAEPPWPRSAPTA